MKFHHVFAISASLAAVSLNVHAADIIGGTSSTVQGTINAPAPGAPSVPKPTVSSGMDAASATSGSIQSSPAKARATSDA